MLRRIMYVLCAVLFLSVAGFGIMSCDSFGKGKDSTTTAPAPATNTNNVTVGKDDDCNDCPKGRGSAKAKVHVTVDVDVDAEGGCNNCDEEAPKKHKKPKPRDSSDTTAVYDDGSNTYVNINKWN